MRKLYLASQSVQRKRLLQDAGFSFEVIGQSADEASCDWGMPLIQLTQHIARMKMAHALVPAGSQRGETCWVLTADSLATNMAQTIIYGKPCDHASAVKMIKDIRSGVIAGAGFCINKKIWDGSRWTLAEQFIGYAQATCIIDVPDNLIEDFFSKLKLINGLNYLQLCGACSITGYGAQFLKDVSGSYTAILGLPMYEVRHGLIKTGFITD